MSEIPILETLDGKRFYTVMLDMDHMSISDALDKFSLALQQAVEYSIDVSCSRSHNHTQELQHIYSTLEVLSSYAYAKKL